MSYFDDLVGELVRCFGEARVRLSTEDDAPDGARCIVLSALGPKSVDIVVYDDADEITVYYGRETHTHLLCSPNVVEEVKAEIERLRESDSVS